MVTVQANVLRATSMKENNLASVESAIAEYADFYRHTFLAREITSDTSFVGESRRDNITFHSPSQVHLFYFVGTRDLVKLA